MSQKKLWMLAAIRPLVLTIVFCGATVGLTACDKANAQNDNPASAVKSEELIRTSQSWDGVELPDYLQGRPELVAVKYEFPAGQKLGWHHHPVMNYGILVQGELTIIGQDGRENTVHGTPSTTARTAARSPSSSTCSISRRRVCPLPCSIRRFRWSNQHPNVQ